MGKNQRVLEVILFFVILALYIHNLSRSIYAGDTGLLVSAAVTHGVAHPPGYPLFTLLGFIITQVGGMTQESPAFLVGMISAVASALSVVFYFKTSVLLTKKFFLSLVSTLTLSTMYLFWFFAEIPEVFALNNLFIILLFYLALFCHKNKSQKHLYFLAFFSGLSLANHLTILLLFPSLAIIVWSNVMEEVRRNKNIIWKLGGFILLGLTPYLYIVVSSLSHPEIDWAHITNLHSFLSFVLRERYGTFQAGYFDTPGVVNRLATLTHYASTVLAQLTLPVCVLCFTAIVKGVIRRSRVIISLVLGFLLIGPLFMLYAGFPLENAFRIGLVERFMAASIIILFTVFPIGLDVVTTFLGKLFSKPIYTTLFVGIFLLIPIQLFIYNYPKTNLSQVTIGDELGKNYLTPLPQNSVLLLASDTSLFNTLYARYSLGYRSDILVLNAIDPKETNIILGKLSKDVTVPNKDTEQSAALLKNIETSDKSYPIFSEVPYKGNQNITWVPYGLIYELRRGEEPKLTSNEFNTRSQKIWSQLKVPLYAKNPTPAYHNLSLSAIYNTYAWALWHTGVYSSNTYNDFTNYASSMLRSLSVYPDFHPALASLGTFALTVAHDCTKALFDYNQALEKDPYNKFYFKLLASAETECHTDKGKIEELKVRYQKLFQEDLFAK
jgi:hypothetical protein